MSLYKAWVLKETLHLCIEYEIKANICIKGLLSRKCYGSKFSYANPYWDVPSNLSNDFSRKMILEKVSENQPKIPPGQMVTVVNGKGQRTGKRKKSLKGRFDVMMLLSKMAVHLFSMVRYVKSFTVNCFSTFSSFLI